MLHSAYLKISRESSMQELQSQTQISKFEFQVQKALNKMALDLAKFYMLLGSYNQAMK